MNRLHLDQYANMANSCNNACHEVQTLTIAKQKHGAKRLHFPAMGGTTEKITSSSSLTDTLIINRYIRINDNVSKNFHT